MTSVWKAAAPATGQPKTQIASPPRALVDSNRTAIEITFSPSEPFGADARAGRVLIRHTTDPRPAPTGTPGLWRTGGDGVRELVSPFALRRITVGRYGVGAEAVLPRTGEKRIYEGNLDQIADAIHRAGVRLGVRGDRQGVFWALREFTALARRQAAARGGC